MFDTDDTVRCKNILTETAKCDIIKRTNNYKRNQLTAEDVGSFMLFRGKPYGYEKEIHAFDHTDHIAQLSRDHSRGKRTFSIADQFRKR